MEQLIKVGIVEDQLLFRDGIRAVLERWQDIEFVFESPDGYSVKDRLEKLQEIPDVMLLDIDLPPDGQSEFNGWDVLAVLRMYYPDMKILILSVHDDEYLIARMIEEGANGYLVKDSTSIEVHHAIVSVYERGSYINERSLEAIQGKLQGKVKTPKTVEDITNREIDVLKLICQQKTTEEIANELFISKKTVNSHRNNLMQKTGSKNMSGLVMYAIKHKIVSPI